MRSVIPPVLSGVAVHAMDRDEVVDKRRGGGGGSGGNDFVFTSAIFAYVSDRPPSSWVGPYTFLADTILSFTSSPFLGNSLHLGLFCCLRIVSYFYPPQTHYPLLFLSVWRH